MTNQTSTKLTPEMLEKAYATNVHYVIEYLMINLDISMLPFEMYTEDYVTYLTFKGTPTVKFSKIDPYTIAVCAKIIFKRQMFRAGSPADSLVASLYSELLKLNRIIYMELINKSSLDVQMVATLNSDAVRCLLEENLEGYLDKRMEAKRLVLLAYESVLKAKNA